jgi:hypothetical protein
MQRESRKEPRSRIGRTVWIRFDDGFSVRACKLVDLSKGGIRIKVDAPRDVATLFSLLMTRNAAPGRRCRVKWRRGFEIGAEFVRSSEDPRERVG